MTTDLQSGAPAGALAAEPKVFGLFSMVLFSVSAILVADTVAASAAMGVQGLGFWIILGLLFFIPYGFVTAELGSAWPDEGGLDDTAPGVFGHVDRRFGTSDDAFVIVGLIATGITILADVLDPDQASVFWTLLALSSIAFLIPYLLVFPALLVLRHKYPDQPRPYVVPGGAAGAWIATLLCEAGILLILCLFFSFPAEGTSKGVFWLITAGGTIISLLIGWWLYWRSSRRNGAGTS
ncbi:MAG: amino acid permease, partial [Thermoleophilia bacterium]|nr:amino acid permease [Thermoleophilia bacterium]